MKPDVIFGGGFIAHHLKKVLRDCIVLHHDQWQHIPKEMNRFYYLAAYGNHYQQTDGRQAFQANVGLLDTVLQELLVKKPSLFVHVSSSSVTLDTYTPYSIGKAAGEIVTRLYHERGLPTISVRPYSIFGEGEADFRFIPSLVSASVTKQAFELAPSPTHDWLYVGDFVKRLMSVKTASPVPLGIGSGVSRTNSQVYLDVVKIVGQKPPTRFQIDKMRSFDTTSWVCPKADVERLTGKIDYTAGLKRTVQFYVRKYEELS